MDILRRATVLSLVLSALGASLPAVAQPSQKVFRVALLSGAGRTPDGAPPGLLREAMRQLGYIQGQNVAYEARFAEGDAERLPALATELVGLKVDVIATLGGPAAIAAKQATSTIPIVMARAAGDAVAAGLIASLARPGGNVTGLTDESVQLSAKRMELLKEAVPKAAVIAVLWNANDQGMTLRYQEIERAARILKVDVQALGVRRPEDFAEAFAAMTRRRPDAMFLVADPLTTMNGGLMSYGSNIEDDFRRAAFYIDRILKGTKPANLPAEQPTRHYLTINAKTAAILGLTLPPALLFRADQLYQ